VDPADPLHDDLETVLDAARRSAELTAQLLAFARKQVVRPRVMELNEVVTITLRMLERLLGEQVEVVWRPAVGLWATVVDPTQVDRVLANLCLNARDAIAGSGRIEITTANVAFGDDEHAAPAGHRPGEWVRLSVHDTGRGMSAEVMKHIFEPFFTTKDAAGGSGLGLATVEGIAAQNGGFVDVASRPGEGSTFSVYLPRSRRLSDPDDRRSPDRRAPGELRLGAGETVLLVEDEVAVLQLVGEQLRRLGYAVLPAGTAEEAVRVAETHPGSIDLILSDVVLPGSSGPTLVEQIGRLRPGAGRLLMSGYPALVSSQGAAPGERVPLLSKPFTLERLAAAVGAALDARPPADPRSTHR
jgi:two-component system cell cycle sensor histidine kinase/response regulator CckA